jgi:hypothetical protein
MPYGAADMPPAPTAPPSGAVRNLFGGGRRCPRVWRTLWGPPYWGVWIKCGILLVVVSVFSWWADAWSSARFLFFPYAVFLWAVLGRVV